jgi:hypothetical protein
MKAALPIMVLGLSFSLAAGPVAADTVTFITGFVKDNNIFTNLSQAFPNTGPGVPGSTVGQANASFLWASPSATPFDLTSNAQGHDFATISSGGGPSAPFTVPIDVKNATEVSLLLAAYQDSSFSIVFTGTGGSSLTFGENVLPGVNVTIGVANFYLGPPGSEESTAIYNFSHAYPAADASVISQTALVVGPAEGAAGTGNSANGFNGFYDLTEVTFILPPDFLGQTLASATLVNVTHDASTLLLGATVDSASAAPEPSTWAMLLIGFGGLGGWIRRRRTMRAEPGSVAPGWRR